MAQGWVVDSVRLDADSRRFTIAPLFTAITRHGVAWPEKVLKPGQLMMLFPLVIVSGNYRTV